jgi:hypothetical protein
MWSSPSSRSLKNTKRHSSWGQHERSWPGAGGQPLDRVVCGRCSILLCYIGYIDTTAALATIHLRGLLLLRMAFVKQCALTCLWACVLLLPGGSAWYSNTHALRHVGCYCMMILTGLIVAAASTLIGFSSKLFVVRNYTSHCLCMQLCLGCLFAVWLTAPSGEPSPCTCEPCFCLSVSRCFVTGAGCIDLI